MKIYKGYLIKIHKDGTCFIQKLDRKNLRDYECPTTKTLEEAKNWIEERTI